MLKILRVLLPSWKFFDGASDAPELYYRVVEDASILGEWKICIPKTKARALKNLFINSEENFHFASHALVEYLKNDLDEDANAQTSLALVKNLVQYQIEALGENAKSFQFKLDTEINSSEPIYLSSVFLSTAYLSPLNASAGSA